MKLDDIYKKIQAYDEALNEAASASINMTGDSAEDVIKLMNALKGEKGADTIDSMPKAIDKPIAPMPVMGPPDMGADMAKLRDIVDGPKDRDQLKPGVQGEPCKICGKDHLGNSGCAEDIEANEGAGLSLDQAREYFFDKHDFADENIQGEYEKMASKMSPEDAETLKKELEEFYPDVAFEGYENEPDEKYQDQHYMTKDLSGGSEQGQKRSYAPTNGGDNPMALEDEIRNELRAQLEAHMGVSEADEDAMEDKKSKILDWIKKYETRIGNNGDTLPEGYVKYFMDSGIFSDAYEQNETAKAEKMIGKPYTEWEYDDQEKALEMMPITGAMFDEIEKITGTSGEEAAEMVADVMDNMSEGDDETDHEHDNEGECPECGKPGKKKLMACAGCGCS